MPTSFWKENTISSFPVTHELACVLMLFFCFCDKIPRSKKRYRTKSLLGLMVPWWLEAPQQAGSWEVTPQPHTQSRGSCQEAEATDFNSQPPESAKEPNVQISEPALIQATTFPSLTPLGLRPYHNAKMHLVPLQKSPLEFYCSY